MAFGARAKAVDADLILDGGHNPHAARALARALEDMNARDPRPLVLVCGMLKTKDPAAFFAALAPLQPRVFTVPFEGEAVILPDALAAARAQTRPRPPTRAPPSTKPSTTRSSQRCAPPCGDLRFALPRR